MDSVQFALALDKFDVSVHQPHPPGYFFYVMLGRLVHSFIGDANTAFVAISIFFSGLAVVAVYFLGKRLFDTKTALVAAVLLVTAPTFWFHGEVALTYAVEAFFSCVTGILCWRILNGEENLIYVSVAVLAVAGGIRQNTPLFLFPLWLFSVRNLRFTRILCAAFLFVLFSLCWFVPMTYMTGGPAEYFSSLAQLWSITGAPSSVFANGWDAFREYSDIIFSYVAYCIGGGIVILVFGLYYMIRNRKVRILASDQAVFLMIWIVPILMFHILVTPGMPGHMLIIVPPLVIVVGRAITFLSNEVYDLFRKNPVVAATAVLTATNCWIFFFTDYPVSFRSIRDHDRNLPIILRTISGSPSSTTLLVMDYNYRFYSFAHVAYYLPWYTISEAKRIQADSVGKRKSLTWINGHASIGDKVVLEKNFKTFVTIVRAVDLLPPYRSNKNITVREVIPGYYIAKGPISLIDAVCPNGRP